LENHTRFTIVSTLDITAGLLYGPKAHVSMASFNTHKTGKYPSQDFTLDGYKLSHMVTHTVTGKQLKVVNNLKLLDFDNLVRMHSSLSGRLGVQFL